MEPSAAAPGWVGWSHPGGKGWIQRGLDRLQRWDWANLVELEKAKFKVLDLGQGSPQHRLGREGIESSPEEKDLGMLVHEKLNRTQPCVLDPQTPPMSWAASKDCGQQVREMAQGAQRSCGCPWIPGSVQGQVGGGLEQPGIVEGVPAHGRE
ncbi:hypothetical protein HGM15179_021389 [Zosterops borbonicus]|uniref:Uncharacterized protein n=1 Tax=Zosterops borbonicus TaxID=364589 RepID=A0A8K1D557_9PASS|nr:hypothetical protein HGM15179_021389 [Zosterops borbonicus]